MIIHLQHSDTVGGSDAHIVVSTGNTSSLFGFIVNLLLAHRTSLVDLEPLIYARCVVLVATRESPQLFA